MLFLIICPIYTALVVVVSGKEIVVGFNQLLTLFLLVTVSVSDDFSPLEECKLSDISF